MALKILFSLRDSGSPRDHDQLCRDAKTIFGMGYAGLEYVLPSRLPGERDEFWELPLLCEVQVIHAGKDYYDGARFASALNEAVEAAKLMEASTINIHPASRHPSLGGRANVKASLRLIRATQAAISRQICCEVLARPAKESQELEQSHRNPGLWHLDVVQHNIYGTLDTTHLASWGRGPVADLCTMKDSLGHIHVSDYDIEKGQQHVLLGQGDLDLRSFLQMTQMLFHTMTITVEPSRRYFEEQGMRVLEVAEQSLKFIHAALE